VSVDVLREVFRLSQSRGVARNVLTVLADAAHPDGVTWLPIAPSKDGDPTRCITHRANASRRAVIDAVDSLAELGEVEVRQAQRGRRRFNVYRVRVGAIALASVDYSDLPFELDRPFSDGVQNPHLVTGSGEVQLTDDEVHFSSRRGANSVADAPTEKPRLAGVSSIFAAPEASREAKPKVEQTEKSAPPEQADVPSSVAALVERSLEYGRPRSPVDQLIDVLPRHEIAANTRSVLERKFSQLPPHFAGLARDELLAAGDDVRSRVRYLNGIADRMLRERGRRAVA